MSQTDEIISYHRHQAAIAEHAADRFPRTPCGPEAHKLYAAAARHNAMADQCEHWRQIARERSQHDS